MGRAQEHADHVTNGAGDAAVALRDAPASARWSIYFLDKYGIPFVFLALVGAALVFVYKQSREDMKTQTAVFVTTMQQQHEATVKALEGNTSAIKELTRTVGENGKQVEQVARSLEFHLRPR